MIDYLVANWIKPLLADLHLIWAHIVKDTQRNSSRFTEITTGLIRKTEWAAIRTQAVNLPFFSPNCYPFRNADGTIFPIVALAPVGHKLS
ncbi:hypothetical protein [Spirosoma panaciterrae]|uniref:hypothetical protein n=1 Tax=Spirosoma panaciterrae TaxID=496058 RepID=UPI00035FDE10|nr:hypothetical protein [Spirosoma panaciterrae]